MTRKKVKVFVALIALLLGIIHFSINTEAAHNRATFYRGNKFMWARDNVDFYYSNGKVTSSSGYQQAGWIFPNISRNLGIVQYYTAPTRHNHRGMHSTAAGVPTPWGDMVLYTNTYVTKIYVLGNGNWYAHSDWYTLYLNTYSRFEMILSKKA